MISQYFHERDFFFFFFTFSLPRDADAAVHVVFLGFPHKTFVFILHLLHPPPSLQASLFYLNIRLLLALVVTSRTLRRMKELEPGWMSQGQERNKRGRKYNIYIYASVYFFFLFCFISNPEIHLDSNWRMK